MTKKVLITGGTGLVGTALTELLVEKDYTVTILTRDKNLTSKHPNITYSYWDINKGIIDKEELLSANYMVHLAGAGIADKPWSEKRKKEILDSRVKPIKLIYNILKNNSHQLKAFISASGVGFYGAITTNTIFDETAPAANDFLGKTCLQWEQAVDELNDLKIRTVKLRTGIVLSKNGGALPKMMQPFKFGLGAALGTGKQIMPWIHIDDLAQLYVAAIENDSFNGAYNAIAGNVSNKNFSKMLSKAMNKPFWLPNVPGFMLKLFLGEMAVILLEGSAASNQKLLQTGFNFQFADLEVALKELVGKQPLFYSN
ncbi:MAG: TIGR01777 family oxidoreductase [Flavobacteriales bacterium]|nr:TIGR01777 family oxidoreductase [Flavobacteriales bacterium]MCW8913134.1 TIGR01777 family oxidoreductase [Flavobacteriales bacterium]MCW8937785.1 TIGR01777 family oxidoreductase [Flavobacteriales bacterium]MCW8940035.1 TIGR01777 family oxidoreductase [Flavobacteriales bacterium]MCW8967403.1 TIGR01777 family oxidoreductase [Flavobacteriales bacterium]